jgi:hypothetical protein
MVDRHGGLWLPLDVRRPGVPPVGDSSEVPAAAVVTTSMLPPALGQIPTTVLVVEQAIAVTADDVCTARPGLFDHQPCRVIVAYAHGVAANDTDRANKSTPRFQEVLDRLRLLYSA